MILRKPYRFLIKNFKLIHLILTLLMVYIIYKFNYIFSFFNMCVNSYTGIITTNATGTLYNIYIYLAIIFIMIISIILIGLLYFKKKPIKLYIVNIISYIIVTILIAYSFKVAGDMQLRIVDAKIIRNVRDFLVIGYGIQVIAIILSLTRTFGFDIKKFDFKKDLEEFDIASEDNEEFELQINVDTNKIHRKYNKGKRYLRYFYKENRYLFFIISAICVVILCFSIYLGFNVYTKKYTQDEYFRTSEFTIGINNAYMTNKDYRGNVISSKNTLIILEINIKNNSSITRKLNLARPELIVGNNKYYHSTIYNDKILDIGNVYMNQDISNEFQKYLLVYEIPNNLLSNKIEFRYVDKTASVSKLESQSTNVSINTRNLDDNKKTLEYNLGDTIDFTGSILGESNFSISSYVLQKIFALPYQFCTKTKCYDSIERITPSITNNYDKTLMITKINSLFDENISISKSLNNFKLLSMFGEFKYEINGNTKKDPSLLKKVDSKNIKNANICILEVINEMENADKIDLILNVRDYIYIYHIK